MSTFGILENPAIEQKVQVAPFTRLNQTRLMMKQMNGHVSDGTALNLGDPSSMRDQGGVRNCVYRGTVSFNESKSMERLPYKQFMRRDGPMNNSFYSFGGAKFIRDETERDQHLLNPLFRDYDGKVNEQDCIIYRKDMNPRVTDYTKNISERIFSPGELGFRQSGTNANKYISKQHRINALREAMRAKKNTTAQDNPLFYATGSQNPRRNLRTKSAQPYSTGTRMLDRLALQINEEAQRKKKLQKDIDEIRSNISMYQASMTAQGM